MGDEVVECLLELFGKVFDDIFYFLGKLCGVVFFEFFIIGGSSESCQLIWLT